MLGMPKESSADVLGVFDAELLLLSQLSSPNVVKVCLMDLFNFLSYTKMKLSAIVRTEPWSLKRSTVVKVKEKLVSTSERTLEQSSIESKSSVNRR